MNGRRLGVGLALVGLMLVAACGGAGSGGGAAAGGGGDGGGSPADGVLKVGYVLPLTGKLAFLGPPMIQALKYARSQINDAGGVLGEPIPPLVAGDEGDQAAVANQSADRVLAAGVDALIGAAASGQSLAIIDKVTGAQVVQCSGSNTAPNFTDYEDGGYYFRTAPSDALQGPVLANTIVADGYSRVAIVARADAYGVGLANATAQALKEAGATVVLNETYDPDTQNFDAVVQQIKRSQPDAAVVISFEEGTQILQGMLEAGLGPDKIGVYGADGLRSEKLPELVAPNNPAALAGMKGTAPASAVNEKFIKKLKEFAPQLTEVQFAPQTFDCLMIIALAAEVAGTDDPSVFKEEIVGVTKDGTECSSYARCQELINAGKNIDYQGASGPLEFIPAGEPGTATIEIYKFNKQGDLVVIDTVTTQPL